MKAKFVLSALFILVVSLGLSHKMLSQSAPGVFSDASHPAGAPDPEKLDQIWQVDPLTGSVSVKIPFTTTPEGGRGPKIPFALSYNSASTVTLQATAGYTQPGMGWWIGVSSSPIITATMKWSPVPVASTAPPGPVGPWTTTGPPLLYASYAQIPDMNNIQVCPGNGAQCYTMNYGYGCTIEGPVIYQDENGAAHDLNIETFQYGFANTDYNNELPPCQNAYNANQTYGTSSYTTDGSAMQTTPYNVVYADGTRAGSGSLTDSNGNTASVTSSGGVTTAKDALGRTIFTENLVYNSNQQLVPGTYYVKTTGPSGNTETYTVVVSSVALGSFSMTHPSDTEISTNFYCIGTINCPSQYAVSQPQSGTTFPAITSVTRPDGTSYTLSYDSTYGTVSKIIFPTGGSVQFDYTVQANSGNYGQFSAVSSVVVTDVYTSTGAGDSEHWSYDITAGMPTPTSKVTAPDSSYTDYTGACYYFSMVPLYQQGARPSCKETSRLEYTSGGTLLKSVYTSYLNAPGPNGASEANGLTNSVATTVYDGPSPYQQLVRYNYDANANVTEKDESDFYACSGTPCPASSIPTTPTGGWKRVTYTNYASLSYTYGSPAQTATIVDKPSQVLVEDGSGNPYALTSYSYDTYGNMLTENKCITITGTGTGATCSTSWQTAYTYDSHGQVTSKTEGNGTSAQAKTTYTWTGPGGTTDSYNGYLTTVTHPITALKDTYTYFSTGQMQTHVDWNSQTTKYSYTDPSSGAADPLNRIRTITAPQTLDGTTGSNASGVTTYTYVDSSGGFTVQEQHLITGSTNTSTVTTYDGLGRKQKTVTASPQCSTGIEVDTLYDSMSRVQSVSNPYCGSANGYTAFYYDALGRKTETILPDGSTSTVAYAGRATETTDPSNGTTNVKHVQQINGLGQLVAVCEEASTLGGGTSGSTCSYNGSTLDFSRTGYVTTYSYDILGNMLGVSQHGVSRSFNYGTLSRLQCASNPEAATASCPATSSTSWVTGTDGYNYSTPSSACAADPSLPCTKTDARGVITHYTYDNMDRLVEKWYSLATGNSIGTTISDLSSCYQYDTAVNADSNPEGQLTLEWQQAGRCPTSAVTSVGSLASSAVAVRLRSQHDALGRVQADQQCLTPGLCSTTVGNFIYTYNLLGSPVQANNGITGSAVTNGSPNPLIAANDVASSNSTGMSTPSITWRTTYDSMGHIQQAVVQDQPASGVWPTATYSSAPVLLQPTNYDPFGHMTGANLNIPNGSNTPAVTISRQYDTRGRITLEQDNGIVVNTVASTSSGTITISGTEAGPFTTAATSGTTTMSVSGSDGSNLVCTTQCNQYTCWQTCNSVPDTGTLSVTVDGFTSSASYGGGSTDASLAQSLSQGFTGSSCPVTSAYGGSNSFSITAKATGSASNYPFTLSNGDFTVSDPNQTLTGGANAGTVYDAGTASASVTVSSVNYTTSITWGQGDTISSIASRLASGLNTAAGTYITAAASGGTITLTSKTTGSNTNYPVSVSITDTQTTNYPQFFPNASFSAAATNMTGGASQGTGAGVIYSYQVPSGGYAANGNILQHVDSVMGTWNFTYDAVDRLVTSSAGAGVPSKYSGMKGCWSYDSFGNRTGEQFITGGSFTNGADATCTPASGATLVASQWSSVSTANNNRLSSTNYGSVTYDASGNTLNDGRNQYWYDAEGQLCTVKNLTSGALIQYAYDAEGARIAELSLSSQPSLATSTCAPPALASSTVTKRFLVDLGGEQVTELNGSGTWQHSNVFSASRLAATYDSSGLHYELADPLGTKRVQASTAGLIEETCVSLPFGNDLNNPLTPSCTVPGGAPTSADDATEHHFTGKERDVESGNDYFFARYYTSALGRFTTPDWSAKVEPVPYVVMADPQSLNLYAYVRNSPIIHVDPDGHDFLKDQNQQWIIDHQISNPDQNLMDAAGVFKFKDQSVSAAGQHFIKMNETIGGKPNLTPYDDTSKLPTIGYGHLIKKGEDFSKGITLEKAEALFQSDLKEKTAFVNKYLAYSLPQNQFDALVDVAFNSPRAAKILIFSIDMKNMPGMWSFFATLPKGMNSIPGALNRRYDEYSYFKWGIPRQNELFTEKKKR